MEAPAAPPAVHYPNQDRVMRAAVRKYPELVNGQAQGGNYTLYIVLREDDSIYDSQLSILVPPFRSSSTPPPNFGLMGMRELLLKYPQDGQVVIDRGQPIADLGHATDEIHAHWIILPAGYDESRIAGRVQDAVWPAHLDLALPTTDLNDRSKVYTELNLLTVFMTEDGQIARHAVEKITIEAAQALDPKPSNALMVMSRVYVPPPVPVEAFKVLGLEADQIGQTGLLRVGEPGISPLPDASTRSGRLAREAIMERTRYGYTLLVRYAWPRRPGEPIGGYPQPKPAP